MVTHIFFTYPCAFLLFSQSPGVESHHQSSVFLLLVHNQKSQIQKAKTFPLYAHLLPNHSFLFADCHTSPLFLFFKERERETVETQRWTPVRNANCARSRKTLFVCVCVCVERSRGGRLFLFSVGSSTFTWKLLFILGGWGGIWASCVTLEAP